MTSRRAARLAVLAATSALTLGAIQPAAAMGGLAGGGQTGSYDSHKQAYFGDLHIHTRFSWDAFVYNVRTSPDDAYNYAKGFAIDHSSGEKIRLKGRPLDFLAVTDHAEYLGVFPAMADPSNPLSRIEIAQSMTSDDVNEQRNFFSFIGTTLVEGERMAELSDLTETRSAWARIVEAADRHYEPGRLTTFAAYEYTSAPDTQNLHRNVVFRGKAPEMPFSAFESQNPEDLWRWLDGLRDQGIDGIAIPHNMNGSDGLMFDRTTYEGDAINQAYSELRMRNEPIVEMSQIKGTSETHPSLSPNDEWAGFELYEYRIGTDTRITQFAGGYVREAMLAGLQMERRGAGNPYRFGMIGASDSHNASTPVEESNFTGKIGIVDDSIQSRDVLGPPIGNPRAAPSELTRSDVFSAAGLAGVWAAENTREAIFDAMRRKETFATSGPRMRVRFFGGAALDDTMLASPEAIAAAYETGVPMGGDLVAPETAPRFLVWAMRDPESTWLQRVQIVKGWIENGETREQVYDVACSDGLKPDPVTHRCPDNGATVDVRTCAVSNDKGATELKAVWRDPDYDAAEPAFYYARVLENPSCRWSTWDALRAGHLPHPDLPATIQERAWSSPIWVNPQEG